MPTTPSPPLPPHAPKDSTTRIPYFKRHVVAIGDLHGDLGNALKVLKMSGVINEDGKWTGDVDYLAQTGDIVDR